MVRLCAALRVAELGSCSRGSTRTVQDFRNGTTVPPQSVVWCSVRFRFPGRKEPFLPSAAGATFSSPDLFKKCPNLKRDEVGVVAASAWSREPHSGDPESSVPVVRTAGTAGELPGPTKLLALDAAPKISIKDCVSVDQKCECERESPELTPSSRREKECA